MEPRRFIRTDVAASVLAHLTLVALILVISEVHPFHSRPSETVSVDIVTPEQVKAEEAKAQEKIDEAKDKQPEPELQLPKLDVTEKTAPVTTPADKQQAASQPPQPKPQQPAQKPPEPAAQPQRPPPQQQAQPTPQALSQPPPQQPPPQQQAAMQPAYQVPQPDVTVKYGVMLGLPPELPPQPSKDAPNDDGGDAKDSIGAKLPPEVVAELRRHLKRCSKMPAGLGPADAIQIKLRTVFATDGTLAREPILIEAPPSAKGVALMKAAMGALQACQPYKMLPADKYEEWKVLDLRFTPGDLGG